MHAFFNEIMHAFLNEIMHAFLNEIMHAFEVMHSDGQWGVWSDAQ